MDDVFFLIFLLTGALVGVAWLVRARHQAGLLRKAAGLLDMRLVPATVGSVARAEGLLRGFRVTIEAAARGVTGRSAEGLTVTVDTGGEVPWDLRLEADSLTGQLGRALGGRRDIETEDRDFDEAVRVGGYEAGVVALLDAETRRAVTRAVGRHGIVVRDGKLSLASRFGAAKELVAAVGDLADLGRRLSLKGRDIASLLGRNVRDDPSWRVRLRNLELLQERFPGAPETARISRLAFGDRHLRVRLRAALGLGAEELEAVIAALGNRDLPDELRRAALAHAIQHLPAPELSPFLAKQVVRLEAPLQLAAIEAVGRRGERRALRWLKAHVASTDRETTRAATRALGEIGGPEAEPLLVTLLSHADERIQTAAAEALAKSGGIGAVEPLLALTGGLLGGGLSAAAAQAVAVIQSRLGDVDVGRLSVVGDDGTRGALSVAGAQGALSVAGEGGVVPSAEGAADGEES